MKKASKAVTKKDLAKYKKDDVKSDMKMIKKAVKKVSGQKAVKPFNKAK